MTRLQITHYTDPACPFAFSAEPVRQRLKWYYGDSLLWDTRMIVLTREQGHAELLAEGADGLQGRYGMPIRRGPYERPASSEPASLAFVAARINAPQSADALLRRLRVRAMLGGLLDDPALIVAAASDVGLDPDALARWTTTPEVRDALEADIAAARSPSPAARALDHKLGGPAGERRYTAPSYEIVNPRTGMTLSVPGFNPVETYETVIANLAPELTRRTAPARVEDILTWAGEPLATAEVAMVAGIGLADAHAALGEVADRIPAGADAYWRPEAPVAA